MNKKLKIVVLGYIVRGPLGGLVWHHFQYVYGLKKLGHEVLFLEDSEEYAACYNPATFELTTDPTYGLNFAKNIFDKYDLAENWAYFDFHTNNWYRKTQKEVNVFLSEADILLNLSGVNPLREWVLRIPIKVFIDTDPVFTQIRHLTDPDALNLARQHNVFFTFGENFGKSSSSIPDDGIDWKHTRQPIVLDLWKSNNQKNSGVWTTVMQWDSYKTREWNQIFYGMKSKSFNHFLTLPQYVPDKFEIALGNETAPRNELEKLGWKITNPLQITQTPFTYKSFINKSKGEWSIAKHGYVVTKSGWFSERSAAYLASGKPVVVQDTGFSDNIACGEGLFGFSELEELRLIFAKINKNYHHHCKKARELCFQFFDHEKVINNLIYFL